MRDFDVMREKVYDNDNEDIEFIAAVVVHGAWEMLDSPQVQPRFFLEDGWNILQDIKQSGGRPTYAAVREKYDRMGVDWPPEDHVLSQIDPKWALSKCVEWWVRASLKETAIDCFAAVESPLSSEEFDNKMLEIQERVALVRSSRGDTHVVGKIGEGSLSLGNDILGVGKKFTQVDTPFSAINDTIGVYEAGMYGVISRPKMGKSHFTAAVASHNGLKHGRVGIIVDPENNQDLIARRVACYAAGLSTQVYKAIQTKAVRYRMATGSDRDQYELTPTEVEFLGYVSELNIEIQRKSRIHIIGKQPGVAPEDQFNVHAIMRYAQEIGAEWIAYDQIQKMYVPSLKGGEDDRARIAKVSNYQSAQDIVTFFTCQTNRKETEQKGYHSSWHYPTDSNIYGADALAQDCVFLAHLRTVKLFEGTPYTDQFGHSRVAQFANIYTPLSVRDALREPPERIIRLIDAYSYDKILSFEDGYRRVSEEFARIRAKEALEGGKKATKEEVDKMSIDSPAVRKGRQIGAKRI